jgi:hypothetical protein
VQAAIKCSLPKRRDRQSSLLSQDYYWNMKSII